jgi:hypothetical protein
MIKTLVVPYIYSVNEIEKTRIKNKKVNLILTNGKFLLKKEVIKRYAASNQLVQ